VAKSTFVYGIKITGDAKSGVAAARQVVASLKSLQSNVSAAYQKMQAMGQQGQVKASAMQKLAAQQEANQVVRDGLQVGRLKLVKLRQCLAAEKAAYNQHLAELNALTAKANTKKLTKKDRLRKSELEGSIPGEGKRIQALQ